MLENQVTVFKNDKHFGGDVVLETTVAFETSTSAYVKVIVIPSDLANNPMGGAMDWVLTVRRDLFDTHTELLEELKRDEYVTEGSSEVVDIIVNPVNELRVAIRNEARQYTEGKGLTDEQFEKVANKLYWEAVDHIGNVSDEVIEDVIKEGE